MKTHAYTAPCSAMTPDAQAETLATYPELLDATVQDLACGGPGWAQLVTVTRPGDVIVVACAGALGDDPAAARARVDQITAKGGRVDVMSEGDGPRG